jgi:hypothetical protein
MTDWDRWTKAGMEKDQAWCVARAPARLGRACRIAQYTLCRRVGFDSAVCWGMLAALIKSGMLEETAAFLQVRASPAVLDAATCPSTVETDACMAHAILQNRPVHLPLLASVVGLSLRPVVLGVPQTAEVDQCRIRFCTSVACVPKLVESVPSAMVRTFRRPRLWRALLPVLANVTSASGLPVVGCVPHLSLFGPRSYRTLIAPANQHAWILGSSERGFLHYSAT